MDLTKYRNKLIGNEDERAVSPVIGVILMVAITVILAAVIAAFVLDLGDDMGSGSVNAAVSSDVSNSGQDVTITVDDMGDAEEFILRGEGIDGDYELGLASTGDSETVSEGNGLNDDTGSANIVAVDGDDESRVGSFEWDWSDADDNEDIEVTFVDEVGEPIEEITSATIESETVDDIENGVAVFTEIDEGEYNVDAESDDGTTYSSESEVTVEDGANIELTEDQSVK